MCCKETPTADNPSWLRQSGRDGIAAVGIALVRTTTTRPKGLAWHRPIESRAPLHNQHRIPESNSVHSQTTAHAQHEQRSWGHLWHGSFHASDQPIPILPGDLGIAVFTRSEKNNIGLGFSLDGEELRWQIIRTTQRKSSSSGHWMLYID